MKGEKYELQRIIVVVATVVLLSIASVGSVFAENEVTFNSKGKILTSSDEVLFDASDFKTLDDEIGKVKTMIYADEFFGDTVSVPNNGEKYCDIPINTNDGYIVGSIIPIASNASISVTSVTNTNIGILIINNTDSYINVQPLVKCIFINQ